MQVAPLFGETNMDGYKRSVWAQRTLLQTFRLPFSLPFFSRSFSRVKVRRKWLGIGWSSFDLIPTACLFYLLSCGITDEVAKQLSLTSLMTWYHILIMIQLRTCLLRKIFLKFRIICGLIFGSIFKCALTFWIAIKIRYWSGFFLNDR